MGFRAYKKEMEKKRERAKVEAEIKNSITVLTKKRDDYVEKAKGALKEGNQAMYGAYVSLLKNAIFNISQSQDLLANYTIANDMLEMQTLNKKAVKEITSIMKDVYKTSAAMNLRQSEAMFNKAMEKRHFTAVQLQQLLNDNRVSFASSVTSLSDIQDTEIKNLLEAEIKKDADGVDDMLGKLEKEFAVTDSDKQE